MTDAFKGVDSKGRALFRYKIGQDLYTIFCDDDGKVEIWTYRIRSIRKGKVAATLVADFTWGKRSSKAGDYGWLPNTPAWTRRTFSENRPVTDLWTTKLQAIRAELKTLDVDHFDSQEAYDRAKRSLKSMETKNRPKKKAP